MDDVWARRHNGVTEDEFVQTLKVLQKFILNTGAQAWHHAIGEANRPASMRSRSPTRLRCPTIAAHTPHFGRARYTHAAPVGPREAAQVDARFHP